jgi:HAD superfamily hydrolase (TIGR01484 family)
VNILVTDLDGTLIPLDGNARNVDDLKLLKQKFAAHGVELVFATGRHLASVEQIIEQQQLPMPSFMIADVGTSIYQRRKNGYELLTGYAEHLMLLVKGISVGALRQQLADISELTAQEDEKQGLYKLSFYVHQSKIKDSLKQIGTKLTEHGSPYQWIDSIDPFNGDGLIDLVPTGVSKVFAIEWLASYLGWSRTQITYAGDSGNDLAPMKIGYRTIVVGNASSAVRDTVTEHFTTNKWDKRLCLANGHATSGVLEGCYRFGLIE